MMSVEEAAEVVAASLASPPYAHTAAFLVDVDGELVADVRRPGGAGRLDVFSVTKTVLATVVGLAEEDSALPSLDAPMASVVPGVSGSWRHLLTMTRGAATDGPWDVDAVTAMPGGQAAHLAAAPQLCPPGERFAYDNGAAHLLSAALGRVLGEPVSAYAERRLFAPLGIRGAEWLADPDGVPFGFAHLRLTADDLLALGRYWLTGSTFLDEMTRKQSEGGPPEDLAYGYLTWVGDGFFAAAGWAGQLVLVVPRARAVVVTTGDPGFSFGPPPRDELPPDWRPAFALVKEHLLPVLSKEHP